MNFKSYVHRRIFNKAVHERKTTSKKYLAAIFLLTSNPAMWNRIKYFIKKDIIQFDAFTMSGCTEDEYTIFLCAKDIYLDSGNITISELTDPTLIKQPLFILILSALEISRHGITMDTNCDGKY